MFANGFRMAAIPRNYQELDPFRISTTYQLLMAGGDGA
jgi:hypothetical protein